MAVEEILTLDASAAITTVDLLEAALTSAAQNFASEMTSALASVAATQVDVPIGADTSALEGEVDAAASAITPPQVPVELDAAAAEASATNTGGKIQAALAGPVDAIRGRFGKLEEEGSHALGKLGIGTEALGGLSVGAAAGVAGIGLAAVEVGKKGVEAFLETASATRALQRVTGATAEQASGLVATFDVLGVSTGSLNTAMFRLGRSIEDGKSKLGDYGIETARTSTGGVDLFNTFLNVSDAVHKAGNGAEASSIAFAAFGRQGISLLPVLSKGREGLEEFFKAAEGHGEILSQKQVDQAKAFTLSINELKAAAHGLEIQIGEGIVPVLTNLTHAFQTVVGAVEKSGVSIGDLGRGIFDAIPGIGTIDVAMRVFGDDSTKTKKATDDFKSAMEQSSAEVKANEEALAAEQKQIESLQKTEESIFATEINLTKSRRDLEQAVKDLAKVHGEKLTPALEDVTLKLLSVAQASQDAAVKEAQLGGKSGAEAAAAGHAAFVRELERVRDTLAAGSPLRANIEGILGRLKAFDATHSSTVRVDASQANATLDHLADRFRGISSGATAHITARAHGGAFHANVPVLVGERGPEIVQFDRAGTVIPNDQIGQFAGAGGRTEINVYEVAGDPRATAWAVAERLGASATR